MGRIRYLKPEFFKDEDIVEHPHWIRLLYQGLWTIADRDGRLEDRPMRIKAEIFPYEEVDIDKGLTELAKIKNHSARPFILRYEVNGEKYIQIINWYKHQKPHHTEKPSLIPVLKGMEKGMGSVHEASGELNNGEATVKKLFLDFVRLSEAEYAKLVEQFSETGVKERIARLNDYIGSKGVKYKSHYYTILTWARKDEPIKSKQPIQKL